MAKRSVAQIEEVEVQPDGRKRREVVAMPGDVLREPTELEVLRNEPMPEVAVQDTAKGLDRARFHLASIRRLRGDVAWKKLSALQRYFLTGVEKLAQEVLGELDEQKQPVTIGRYLGWDPETRRPVA